MIRGRCSVFENISGMGHFLKEISFQGIELANLIDAQVANKKLLRDKLQEFIDNGSVKPLTRTVFAARHVEQAFRYSTDYRLQTTSSCLYSTYMYTRHPLEHGSGDLRRNFRTSGARLV